MLRNVPACLLPVASFGAGDGSIGMDELRDTGSFQVFPNPADDHIVVQGLEAGALLEIHGASGRRELVTLERRIATDTWEPGLYLARSGGRTQRIIIQR
ncbi:MAG: T9SS type A sorting domain-containing protein [Flavobacteriales bacterium]|nr:T9SS type A sorting domain-containing protein [Flavobacteriales bacterium]